MFEPTLGTGTLADRTLRQHELLCLSAGLSLSVISDILRTCLKREHLVRTGTITLLVGTWLTLFNQGDVLISGGVDSWLLVKVLLNYLTPFVVANAGLLSRQSE